MTYLISNSMNQLASIKHQNFSSTYPMSTSAQLSKFQRIGYLRNQVLAAFESGSGTASLQQDQAINHLVSAEHLDLVSAVIITSPGAEHKCVFEAAWDSLTDYDKAIAFWLNYRVSENYWPHWDIYSQALLPHIRFPSGTPESIIGSPYQALPNIWAEQKDSLFRKCRSGPPRANTIAGNAICVYDEHHWAEVGCRDHYFNMAQQVYIIVNALDAGYDNQANHVDASELLQRLKFPKRLIQALIAGNSWPSRFYALWNCLNKEQKKDLITEDWTYYDNYWPGLEDYNQKLCSIIDLSLEQSMDDCTIHDATPR